MEVSTEVSVFLMKVGFVVMMLVAGYGYMLELKRAYKRNVAEYKKQQALKKKGKENE